MLYCGCYIPLEIWIAVLKERDFLEVIAINGKIILKYILMQYWNMWTAFLWF
jgi:hypothetical protein